MWIVIRAAARNVYRRDAMRREHSHYLIGSVKIHRQRSVCIHAEPTLIRYPGYPLVARLSQIRDRGHARDLRSGTFGYWIAGAAGRIPAFGDVPDVGDPQRLGLRDPIRAIVTHPSRRGYWALGSRRWRVHLRPRRVLRLDGRSV